MVCYDADIRSNHGFCESGAYDNDVELSVLHLKPGSMGGEGFLRSQEATYDMSHVK
jgi:hypothetical protein